MKVADAIGYAILIAIFFECVVIVAKAIAAEDRRKDQ